MFGFNTDNRTYDYTTGSGLTVKGAGKDYLRRKFMSGRADSQAQIVKADLYLDCCQRWLSFSITYEGVNYCPIDCAVSVDLQRLTDASRAYRYLNDTIYWTKGFVEAYTHPRVYYCTQPGALQFVLLALLPMLFTLIIAIQTIATVVKGICKFISFGIAKCDLGAVEDINICSYYELIGGCGRYAPSPLVREILEFNAAAAGLRLQSTIFQTLPYKNLALFQLQYEKGARSSANWIQENGANLTSIQLLGKLESVYKLDFRIIGDALVVERDAYFDNLSLAVGEVETCFRFIQETAKAYGRFEYADDAIDQQGNRLKFNYDDIVEWNAENAAWKRGEHTVINTFGRARFMFDQRGADRGDDVPGGDNEPLLGDNYIDRFRSTNLLNNFGCRDDRRERDLLLTSNRASNLKLLVLEDGFNRMDAHTIRKPYADGFFAYNFPMYYREDEPEGLYQGFHYSANPNLPGRYIYEADDSDLDWSCKLFSDIFDGETGYLVETEVGMGRAETIEIKPSERVITAKGIKVKQA